MQGTILRPNKTDSGSSLASELCFPPIRISYQVQRIFQLLLPGVGVLDWPHAACSGKTKLGRDAGLSRS
jgi:hypothetical protein